MNEGGVIAILDVNMYISPQDSLLNLNSRDLFNLSQSMKLDLKDAGTDGHILVVRMRNPLNILTAAGNADRRKTV